MVRQLTWPEIFFPPRESALELKLPFRPANLFSFKTMLMIPAIPSGSYLAPGLVITSTSAMLAAGMLRKSDFTSPPAMVDGFPSIMRFTWELPRRLTLSSMSTSTPGTWRRTSMADPPVERVFSSAEKIRFWAVWINMGRSPIT